METVLAKDLKTLFVEKLEAGERLKFVYEIHGGREILEIEKLISNNYCLTVNEAYFFSYKITKQTLYLRRNFLGEDVKLKIKFENITELVEPKEEQTQTQPQEIDNLSLEVVGEGKYRMLIHFIYADDYHALHEEGEAAQKANIHRYPASTLKGVRRRETKAAKEFYNPQNHFGFCDSDERYMLAKHADPAQTLERQKTDFFPASDKDIFWKINFFKSKEPHAGLINKYVVSHCNGKPAYRWNSYQ